MYLSDKTVNQIFDFCFKIKIERSGKGHILFIGLFWIIFAAITFLGLK